MISSLALLLLCTASPGCKPSKEAKIKPAEAPDPADAFAPPTDPQSVDALRQLTPVFEKALAGYNAGDRAALFAEFATTANPPATEQIFRDLFEGYYKTEFGRVTNVRLYPQETVADPDYGMLVFVAQCEHTSLARVSVNFIRENGAPKIVQMRFEKIQVPAK